MSGGEHDQAMGLTRALGIRSADHVFTVAARRAEAIGQWDLASELLSRTRDSATMLTLLCARFSVAHHGRETREFFARCGLRTPEAFSQCAAEAESRGRAVEAVRCHVAAGEAFHGKAIEIGLAFLRRELSKKDWDAAPVNEVLEAMACVPLASVTEASGPAAMPKRRAEVLAIAFFVAGFNAWWLGFSPIIPFIASSFVKVEKELGTSDVGIDASPLIAIETLAAIKSGDMKRATSACGSMAESSPIRLPLSKWISAASSAPGSAPSLAKTMGETSASNIVKMSAGTLPARRPTTSAISGDEIKGQVVEVDRKSISRAEAIMWDRVCPFPPFGLLPINPIM